MILSGGFCALYIPRAALYTLPMRFSIVILTHNNLARTQRCLSDLVAFTDCRDYELIVVDNGSADGTAEWQRDTFAPLCKNRGVMLKRLRNSTNIGCSPARNQGIDAADGGLCVFLDNDVSPRTTRWLQGLEAALEPGVGMVGPKMVYPSRPHRIQCAGVGVSKRGNVMFLGRGEEIGAPPFNTPADVQALISACLLVPKKLLAEHGGFDPLFHPVQFEDFDLCYRLRGRGFRARCAPGVEMYHFESSTTRGVSGARNAAAVIRNGLAFKQRWARVFENEDGPPDALCRWRELPPEVFAYDDAPLERI